MRLAASPFSSNYDLLDMDLIRRNEYVLVERLSFRGALMDYAVVGLKSLDRGQLLIVTADGSLIAKPLYGQPNYSNNGFQLNSSCVLL